ncbi:MAG: hypothetical protein ACE5HB_05365 [Terriglobia bacterium]
MARGAHIALVTLFSLFCVCAAQAADKQSGQTLTSQNRLAIVRELAHEYAVAKQPLPRSKKVEESLTVDAQGQVDEDGLRQALVNRGFAVRPGELLQITGLEFKGNFILFEINGGGPKKRKWWQRITIGAGTVGSGPRIEQERPPPPPPTAEEQARSQIGTWILLKFPHRVPDITPDELKEILAGVLDFTQRSAAQQWIETVPEEFREAIKENRPMVGMTREMVRVAMGRPNKKVRETREGVEYEDWIYGNPPFVTFVVFVGDDVVEIKEFK